MGKRLAWHLGSDGIWAYGYASHHGVMSPKDVLGTVEINDSPYKDWKASAAGQEITKNNAEAAKAWVVQTARESKEQEGSEE